MRQAIKQAILAAESGETPVGSVLVNGQTIIGRAHNQVELLKDPTAHAEMIAITQGAAVTGDWRLAGTTLYVTKEPCQMCAGAIALARISRVVFGVSDPRKTGTMDSAGITRGVMETECRTLLEEFFRTLRERNRRAKSRRGATTAPHNGMKARKLLP